MSSRSCGQALASGLALSLLGACATWQVQDVTPQVLLSTRMLEIIQVTRLDSTQVELRAPRLEGDTIVGARHGRLERVPVADVSAVAVRGGGGGGTVIAVAAAFGLVMLIVTTDTSPDFDGLQVDCYGTTGNSTAC